MAVTLPISFYGMKSGQWKGTIKREAGVDVTRNPLNPLYKTKTSTFEPEFSIRESESNSAFTFVRISGLLIDKDDNVYVLDSRDANIKVFNRRGQFIRFIGKKGQGPGEFDSPSGMDFFSETEIAVLDGGNRRLTIFGLSGAYLSSFSYSGFSLASIRADAKGNFYGISAALKGNQSKYELLKLDSNFHPLLTIDATGFQEIRGVPFLAAYHSFTIGRNGLIYYGFPETDYEIKAYDGAGALRKKIQKVFVPERIPQDELDAIGKGLKQRPYAYVPDDYPPYFYIDDNEEDKLIVLARMYYKTRAYDFDVFDLEGRFLETKRFVPNYGASYFKWKKSRLYVAEEEESGLPVIRIYRVKWAGT